MPKKRFAAEEFVLAKRGCGRGRKGGTRVETRAAAAFNKPDARAFPALFGAHGGVVLLTTGTGDDEDELALKEGGRAVVVETNEGSGWPPVAFVPGFAP